MNNKEFAIKCGDWLNEMFNDVSFTIKICDTERLPVSMSYFGGAPTIVIPLAYIEKSESIENKYDVDAGKLFLLSIICHELTHLLYYHHDQETVNSEEKMSATELWADFFGAIIFSYLVYFNAEIISSILITKHNSEDELLATYGCVIEEILEFIDSVPESNCYPPAAERIQAMIIGPLSFYGRLHGYNYDRKIWAMGKIYGKTSLMKYTIDSNFNPENYSLLSSCREAHIDLKKNDYSLLSNMKGSVSDIIKPEFI